MATNGADLARSALVLYGTETGTSQDLAGELGRCLQRLRFEVNVHELDDTSYVKFTNFQIVVFAISTTGQGDFPSNSRKLWLSLLKKRLNANTLAGVQYALLGLGDSSYPKFNWAARKLDKRLKQLGAQGVVESCEADEQGEDGTDGAFLSWIPQFRSAVLSHYPLKDGEEPIPDNILLPSKWILERQDEIQKEVGNLAPIRKPGSFEVVVQETRRVTPIEHWQDVRFMTLHTDSTIDYLPGDALAIQPENMPCDVQTFIDDMGWQDVADDTLSFKLNNSSTVHPYSSNAAPLPPILTSKELTLRHLLTSHLDIHAIPRRSFFAAVANYTSDDMHKTRLVEFTDPQYLDEYYDYATRPRRSIVEILQEFASVRIPWQEVVNIFPPLRPRLFSIASGGVRKQKNVGTTTFDLLIAIVKYRTVIKRIREGVCTRYIASLPAGSKLSVALRQDGRFSSEGELANSNHILVGAGTGVAPLRALIQEKLMSQRTPVPKLSTTLVYGGRNESADYFFHEDWMQLDASSPNSFHPLEIITAFSRDQSKKVYVQDRVREYHAHIGRLLRDPATVVVVCGASGQMPKAVRQALNDALVASSGAGENVEGGTAEAAELYLVRMEKAGRYKQETWS